MDNNILNQEPELDAIDSNNENNKLNIHIPGNKNFDKNIVWDEKKLAELVGYQGLSTESFVEHIQTPLENPNSNIDSNSTDENISTPGAELTQSELFDEPVKNRTKPSLASNPFAKLGTVGISMAVIFGLGGLLFTLTTLTNNKPKPKPQIAATNQINGAKTDQNPDGQLKTQIALDKQAQMIKQYGNTPTTSPTPGLQQKPLPVTGNTANQVAQPTPNPAPTPIQNIPPRQTYVPPQPQAVVKYTPQQIQRPVAVVARYTPPVSLPIRSAQPNYLVQGRVQPAPRISTPAPQQVQRTVSSSPAVSSQPTAAPNTDPQGSYGQVSLAYLQQAYSTTQSPAAQQKVLGNATQNTASPSPEGIPRVVPVNTGYQTSSLPPTQSSTNTTNEEYNIINRVPMRTLQVGESASATLVDPLVSTGQQSAQSFIVKLSQPLLDANNTEILPAGTSIVASVSSVTDGGLTSLIAQRVILDGNEYILPANTISIRGTDQKPLIAKKINKGGGTSWTANLGSAFWGALANVGQVLTRPDSTTSISTGTLSTSSVSGGRDVFGAALQGGANPLLTQAQNQAQYQQTQNQNSHTPVWYMASGTPVVVFVNQTFEF